MKNLFSSTSFEGKALDVAVMGIQGTAVLTSGEDTASDSSS
jgi:hypothetical protein